METARAWKRKGMLQLWLRRYLKKILPLVRDVPGSYVEEFTKPGNATYARAQFWLIDFQTWLSSA